MSTGLVAWGVMGGPLGLVAMGTYPVSAEGVMSSHYSPFASASPLCSPSASSGAPFLLSGKRNRGKRTAPQAPGGLPPAKTSWWIGRGQVAYSFRWHALTAGACAERGRALLHVLGYAFVKAISYRDRAPAKDLKVDPQHPEGLPAPVAHRDGDACA